MKVIPRDGAVINYHISGNGDTTLLFVHGSYIDQTYWKDQVKYFNPQYTVVTLDLPGHGKSGKQREHWSLKGYAEDHLRTDFENTNEQYARMVLLTPQTAPEITNRIIKDYRNAYKPMGSATTHDVFRMCQTEKELLPELEFKLYLINVDYMPTNEAPLQQYAPGGYELMHMKGTCHYPMLENPDELNRLLKSAIDKILKI